MLTMPKLIKAFLFVFLVVLAGCSTPAATPTPAEPVRQLPAITGIPPTFTPLPPGEQLLPTQPVITVTQEPLPTVPTKTPVPFGDTAVELRYTIPELNLDRRLQGGINSQIILVDETTGKAIKRANQAGVLLELQQALPDLLLSPVPEGCSGCVHFSYELPFAQEKAEGWLQDPTLLASLDNYLNVSLGPHFPSGTAVGLYRRATPFAPAHTIAITEDGLMYSWLATESEVTAPVVVEPAVLDDLNNLTLDDLADEYVTACSGTSPELLYLRQGDVAKEITILCPEFSLPAPLVPLYAQLDAALETKLAASENVLERPLAAFPLDALLDYKRIDGAELTIYQDGTAVALSGGEVITGTIGSSDIISVTTGLLDSGVMSGDLSLYATSIAPPDDGTTTPPPPQSLVIMRGDSGVLNGAWPEAEIPALALLNAILDDLLAGLTDTAVPEGTITPESTPSVTATPGS